MRMIHHLQAQRMVCLAMLPKKEDVSPDQVFPSWSPYQPFLLHLSDYVFHLEIYSHVLELERKL
jgi:hypothetical protein